MPADRPRYLMGVGMPADFVQYAAHGVDMFDCVIPTRNARNGQAFTTSGRLNIRNAAHAADPARFEEGASARVREIHRAYLTPVPVRRDPRAPAPDAAQPHLLQGLMTRVRDAIMAGGYAAFVKAFMDGPEARHKET